MSAENQPRRPPVNAGLLALSMLRGDVRHRLIGAWMQSGGGTAQPSTTRAGSLIDFLAGALPDPSPELALCRVEQIALRAFHQAQTFERPDPALLEPRRLVRRAAHAGLVLFPGGCEPILGKLLRLKRLPVHADDAVPLLTAPGASPLYRLASADEHDLWRRLSHPTSVADLLQAGSRIGTIAVMLGIGALEYVW